MRVNLINATNGQVIKSTDTTDIRKYLSKDTISSTTKKGSKENKTMRVNIVTKKVSVADNTVAENTTPVTNNVQINPVVNNTTTDNVEKKVTKTINVRLGGRSTEKKEETKKTSSVLSVKLVNKKVRTSNNGNKNKKMDRINTSTMNNSVDTHSNDRKKFNRNTNDVEAPIVKSVINVSLGGHRSTSTDSQIIKATADTSDHKLNIYTSPKKENNPEKVVEEVKEEKIEEEKPVVEETVVKTPEVVEELKVEEIKAEEVVKEEVESTKEENVEEVENTTEPETDLFESAISEIPTTVKEEVIWEEPEDSKEGSDDYEKIKVWYMNTLPEGDLSKYNGEVIAILTSDCAEEDRKTGFEMCVYTELNLRDYDNIYISEGKPYIISKFEEEDNEVKIIITDYDGYVDDSAAQTDESETSTEEESVDNTESISSMSDEDVINRIINASSSKPSVSDMIKNK